MAELLGQGVVVENVSGVGGLIGTNRVAAARPDGYTLAALNNSILTILPHMQKGQTKFDSFADFVPLRGVTFRPTSACPRTRPSGTCRRSSPAKAKPGDLNYSTGGPGARISPPRCSST